MTTKTFAMTKPINLVARVGHGSIRVSALDNLIEARVTVTARAEPSQILERTTVQLSGATLQITSPRQGGVFELFGGGTHDAVDIEVMVPTGTPIKISSDTADITVTGSCGDADIATAASDVNAEHVDGDLRLRYGGGNCRIERVRGTVQARSGSGAAQFGEVGGALSVVSGKGQLEVGTARGAVRFRAGSGAAIIGAVYDSVDLASGSGNISIGVPTGVSAQVDLSTSSGVLDPQLAISGTSTAVSGAIRIRARTGSGDIRLVRAVA